MDISTTGIEIMIDSYTKGLDRERAKCAAIARGEIQVAPEQREHSIQQSQMEITRLQGVIQGLVMARTELVAQLEIQAEREVVEDFPRTERVYMTAEAAAAASQR